METHSAEIWRHDAFDGDAICRLIKCSSASETLEKRDEDWEELCALLNEYKKKETKSTRGNLMAWHDKQAMQEN